MTTIKVDVSWCPINPNRFITIGTDLRLYQVESLKEIPRKSSASIPLSDNSVATLLAVNSDYQYMRCVSWYLKPDSDHLLAIGQENGKVVLTGFGHGFNNVGLVGREFVPRHARRCTGVSWNPVEYHLLAAGLEKHKGDRSILVWDVNDHQEKLNKTTSDSSSWSKPVVELGTSEATQSFQWFTQQPKLLVCGMNNKLLKIFDLRDSSKHQNITATKAVFGICVDPFYEHRLASFCETHLAFWDIRNFEKPVTTIQNETRHISKIAWSPSRSNLIGIVTRDCSVVKLYDVQQCFGAGEDAEPTVVERCIQPNSQYPVSSFSWHPSHENRMLIISPNGTLKDYTVFDRITLNWSPTSELVWTHGKKIMHCLDEQDSVYELLDDISVKMRQRAVSGYGLKSQQLWQNAELAADDTHLHGLWTWLDLVKSLQEENKMKSGGKVDNVKGVCECIVGESGLGPQICSQPTSQSWVGLDSSNFSTPKRVTVFSCKEREKVLQLCGWGADVDGSSIGLLIERLELDGQYEKAAAISIFNLRMRQAIRVLNKGASHSAGGDVNLSMVAMALSGYTDDKGALWREMCQTLRPQLGNSYLSAMFAFLTCDDDNYEEVVNEAKMAVQDRVAFACMYLNDMKLSRFVESLTTKMVADGNLDGILLTGLSEDGLKLLQNYVDRTGDVQTASLVVLQSHPGVTSSDGRAQLWVECYRNLLDQWRLWHQRAQFDCQWNKINTSGVPPQQIFVSCNFCGKSVSSYLQTMFQGRTPRNYAFMNVPATNKLRIICCPGCRKPLPRCSLCLTNMGTPSGTFWRKAATEQEQSKEEKLAKFSTWFTWCQTCRHGGHALHLIEWFKEHTECPVAGCTCKCMSLDAVTKKTDLLKL